MYTNTVLEYCQRRDTIGPLAGATHQGVAGAQGDGSYMVLWLEVRQERILRAAYSTIGCPAAIACGSWTAAWLVGKSSAEALQLTEAMIVTGLGSLPEGKEHCPRLAVEVIRKALEGGDHE